MAPCCSISPSGNPVCCARNVDSNLVAIYTKTLDHCGFHSIPLRSPYLPPITSTISTKVFTSRPMLKRVHFAQTTTVYEETSSTPSPSLSIASLPSSSSLELPTPPPEEDANHPTVVYPATPFVTHQHQLEPSSPDLAYASKMMQIHYTLAFSPFNEPAIPWDMSYPLPMPLPIVQDERIILTPQTLADPATSPPLMSLTVTHPNLKWSIEILPKDPTPGAFVSIGDVFTALFKELRLAIQPLEYAELPEGEIRSEVDAAYFSRCGSIPDAQLRLLEHQKGIKRIDLFRGQTRFMGLSGTLTAPDIWELNVS